MATLYFAFGSNMETRQMHQRCRGARALGAAELEGWRLAFRRGATSTGVATIVPDLEATVLGRLWSVSGADLDALDKCEGVASGIYLRSWVTVRFSNRTVRAHAYLLADQDAAEAAPRADYLERIAAGWRTCGWPVPELAACAGLHPVFVYGTLKRGHGNACLVDGTAFLGESSTRGALGSLGAFPVMSSVGRSLVHGELRAVDDATLDRLDRLEGHPNFYQRSRVELCEGGMTWAYTQASEKVRRLPKVDGGRWVGAVRDDILLFG